VTSIEHKLGFNTITMSRSLSPQTSMTLSVTRDDAHRMLEASRALNKRLSTLQQERDEPKPNDSTEQLDSVPQRVVSTSENGSVASDDSPKASESSTLMVEAAASCGNALVKMFLASLTGMPSYEMRVCLILFLDMGKSTKLMEAFRTLSKAKSEEKMSMTLTTDGAFSLFRCFLTAISLCIQQPPVKKKNISAKDDEPPRKAVKEDEKASPNSKKLEVEPERDSVLPCASPSFDSDMGVGDHTIVLAEETRKEIDEIALFASDLLLDYVKKQMNDGTVSSITFEQFGSWYNAGGSSIVPWLELLDLSKWEAAWAINTHAAQTKAELRKSPVSPTQPSVKKEPTVNFFSSGSDGNGEQESRPIVSFDFTGAMSSADSGKTTQHSPFCINISEENLLMLQNLVNRTGMASRSPQEVCDVLIHHSANQGDKHLLVLHRSHFPRCIRDLVRPEAYSSFSKTEMEDFSTYFTDFFRCFEYGTDGLGTDQVNVKELAVGFSFLCAGNKSAKLAAGFELLDEECSGHLSIQQLTRYVRSYLTMLVGISLLSANPGENKALSTEKRNSMNEAVDNGARWTLGHVQRYFCETGVPNKESVSFEDFANWYTVCGYKVAPWLELLDLSKLLTLLGEADINYSRAPSSNRLRQTSRSASKSPSDVLFTFPLSNRRSLVVLREDAVYVRSVVETLALLPLSAEQLWTDLYKSARAQPALLPVRHRKSGTGKCMDVDQATFVRCMAGVMESISTSGRKRASAKSSKISPAARETLMNFFHSYDLEQVDRVGLNELMGGLCLLCGGKKSTKLAFAFGLFDGRCTGKKNKKTETSHSLNGEELFLFFRSFLIIIFSCCQQSMDLSAEQVGRYISDSAHMVVQDVMQYQWNTRKRDRIDFDDFGEWYNEGGFETAPWLELLDLVKWVLAPDFDAVKGHVAPQKPVIPTANGRHVKSERPSPPWTASGNDCPPPPPEDALDGSFFADDGHELMQMDSMDEMDIMLMQAPSQDKENDGNRTSLLLMSPNSRVPYQSNTRPDNSFKFHVITYEEHGGYMLSVSQRRVYHLGHILTESGLYQIDTEEASRSILSWAISSKSTKGRSKGNKEDLILTKDGFDSAMRHVISLVRDKANIALDTQRVLSELLARIFNAFDRSDTGKASAMEIACGLMVLCAGKKSDKLECGFELFDSNQDGRLSRLEMSNYLKSFLTVLLSVVSAPCLDSDATEDSFSFVKGGPCDPELSTITRASCRGSDWATGEAFGAVSKAGGDGETMSFDSFAEWYTSVGYTSIPWLELLDLRKWVFASSR
jgi:Ca2+-binding EF-hand superfamily protein